MQEILRVYFLSLLIVFVFPSVAFAEVEAPVTEPEEVSEQLPTPADNESKWDRFTFSPKVGWMYLMDNGGTGIEMTESATISNINSKRHAMKIGFGLEFGGEGTGYDLQFIYGLAKTENDIWHSLGIYNGFSYRMHFKDWYPYFGLGISLGTIFADLGFGLEAIARQPFGVTYYISEDLGIVAEFGLGYQATLIFGSYVAFIAHGLYLDCSVGIRWP